MVLSSGAAGARSYSQKVIILVATGNTDESSLALAQAQIAAGSGIRIYTVGVGSTANASLLSTIADTTGGKYYSVDTGESDYDETMEDIFREVSLYRVPSQLISN